MRSRCLRSIRGLVVWSCLLSGCHLWFGEDGAYEQPPRPDAAPQPFPSPDAGAVSDAAEPDCGSHPDAPPMPDPPPPDAPPQPDPPPDAPPADAPSSSPHKRVFVTSAPYDADFAQIADGDAHAAGDFLCNAAAQSVFAGGTWRVWLSTDAVDAIDRIADVGPWYRMTGDTIVFNNKANLYTLPLAAIDQHETGETVLWGAHYAWTGTVVGGASAVETCENWTSIDAATTGVFGSAKTTAASWVDLDDQACNLRARLYCFEQ